MHKHELSLRGVGKAQLQSLVALLLRIATTTTTADSSLNASRGIGTGCSCLVIPCGYILFCITPNLNIIMDTCQNDCFAVLAGCICSVFSGFDGLIVTA